MKTRKCLSR